MKEENDNIKHLNNTKLGLFLMAQTMVLFLENGMNFCLFFNNLELYSKFQFWSATKNLESGS